MNNPRFIRFSLLDRILFLRRLSLYLRAGVSLSAGLAFIMEDTRSPAVLSLIKRIEESVARGNPLSQGFALFPRHFDRFTQGLVEAGEQSGTLASTLEQLAHLLEKRRLLRQKILSALAYPLLIVGGTVGIVIFLMAVIFPKILPVLSGLHTSLPLPTRILIGINSFVTHEWLGIVVGVVVMLGACAGLLRLRRVRRILEYVLLRTPVVGELYRSYLLTTFLRVLAQLLGGGIRILTALALVRAAMPSIRYAETILALEAEIMEGHRLSRTLEKYPHLFPSVIKQMIAAGEATGTLRENLDALGGLYENSLNELTQNLTLLIEPVLMIVMGAVVGFVALAIITPVYQVTQGLETQP